MRDYRSKIVSRRALVAARKRLRQQGATVVFTNGCFDLLHAGHVEYLAFARRLGDVLAVGLNSDASVRRNKGRGRPVVGEKDRARVLAGLEAVDYVVVFGEKEPAALIAAVLPDVLVKAEDWKHYVSGREVVEKNGGRVVLAPLLKGRSTSRLLAKFAGRGRGGR